MGSHTHPCCERNVNKPSPVATLPQSHALHPAFTAVVLNVVASILPAAENEFRPLEFASPPHLPPSLNSQLRI